MLYFKSMISKSFLIHIISNEYHMKFLWKSSEVNYNVMFNNGEKKLCWYIWKCWLGLALFIVSLEFVKERSYWKLIQTCPEVVLLMTGQSELTSSPVCIFYSGERSSRKRCPGYVTKLHLVVRLQFWSYAECRIPPYIDPTHISYSNSIC